MCSRKLGFITLQVLNVAITISTNGRTGPPEATTALVNVWKQNVLEVIV
jgi:hypothetical protein